MPDGTQHHSLQTDTATAVESPPMFTRIQIQTVSWCNRSCAFCPSGKFPVGKTFMPLDVYHRVIDQLHALDFCGRISPYLMNESLLDKRLPDLIAYARQQCPESWIAINTNGDAVSASLIERLFDTGLNCMDINAYDDVAQYESFLALAEQRRRPACRYPTDEWLSGSKFQGCGFAPSHQTLALPGYERLGTPLSRPSRCVGFAQPGRQCPRRHPVGRATGHGCERPFRQMYINHRGEAVLCCNDWRFEVVMGDTAEAFLDEIWNNGKYRTYREHLQRDDRHLPLCASCDYAGKPKAS